MKIQIHKRKIYIWPKPKKDIKDGLLIALNKPLREGETPILKNDIIAYEKEYPLPDLPQGVYVIKVFVKEDGK